MVRVVGVFAPQRDTRSNADRVWGRVDKDGPVPAHRPDLGRCWLWTGPTAGGYGQSSVFTPAGRWTTAQAHRVVWEMARGAVPVGLELDHLCRVRACVNPAHLEPVTHRENIRRAYRAQREATQ